LPVSLTRSIGTRIPQVTLSSHINQAPRFKSKKVAGTGDIQRTRKSEDDNKTYRSVRRVLELLTTGHSGSIALHLPSEHLTKSSNGAKENCHIHRLHYRAGVFLSKVCRNPALTDPFRSLDLTYWTLRHIYPLGSFRVRGTSIPLLWYPDKLAALSNDPGHNVARRSRTFRSMKC
jgi:hypothetical protein